MAAHKATNARPRWLMLFFCSGAISAKTLPGLLKANLVPAGTEKVKIILSGKLSKAYVVKDKSITATQGARSAIEAAGGRLEG